MAELQSVEELNGGAATAAHPSCSIRLQPCCSTAQPLPRGRLLDALPCIASCACALLGQSVCSAQACNATALMPHCLAVTWIELSNSSIALAGEWRTRPGCPGQLLFAPSQHATPASVPSLPAGEPIGSASTTNGALGVCALACQQNPSCTSFIFCKLGPADPCQVPAAGGQRRSIPGGTCDLLSQAGRNDTNGLMALSGPVVGELAAGGWATLWQAGRRCCACCARGSSGMAPTLRACVRCPAGAPVRSQAASLSGYASLRGIVPPFDLGIWTPEYIADGEM